jgi:hypothetical protein
MDLNSSGLVCVHIQTRLNAALHGPCGDPYYEELSCDGQDLRQLMALEELWQGTQVSEGKVRESSWSDLACNFHASVAGKCASGSSYEGQPYQAE